MAESSRGAGTQPFSTHGETCDTGGPSVEYFDEENPTLAQHRDESFELVVDPEVGGHSPPLRDPTSEGATIVQHTHHDEEDEGDDDSEGSDDDVDQRARADHAPVREVTRPSEGGFSPQEAEIPLPDDDTTAVRRVSFSATVRGRGEEPVVASTTEARATVDSAGRDATTTDVAGAPRSQPPPYDYLPEAQLVQPAASAGYVGQGYDADGYVVGVPVGFGDGGDTDGGDGEGEGVVQAAPDGGDDVVDADTLTAMVRAYQYARTVRPCASTEVLVLAVSALTLGYFLVLLPFPFVIYFGARVYNAPTVGVASVLLAPAAIAMRIFSMTLANKEREDPSRVIIMVLLGLVILVDLYLAFVSVRLARHLRRMDPEVIERLPRWTPTDDDIARVTAHVAELDG
jgi:hypothetical protein